MSAQAKDFLLENYHLMEGCGGIKQGIATMMQSYADHCEDSKWIEVDGDDSPDEDVLATDGTDYLIGRLCNINDRFFGCWNAVSNLTLKATHWQPLPTPPKA